MIAPTFDAVGYPTDETRDAIRNWPASDPKGLAAFVAEAWRGVYGSIYFDDTGKIAELNTGGWSGNESIVDALQDNTAFWSRYFLGSLGGRFKFRKGFDVNVSESAAS